MALWWHCATSIFFLVPNWSSSPQKCQRSQSTSTTPEDLLVMSFFNPDGLRKRPRSCHKMLTTWKYPLCTSVPCGCPRLMATWISGLRVKALSMIWQTQLLWIQTVPFLLTCYKGQVIIAGSSKPPYRHCTLNKHVNSPSFITASFLVLYLR